MDRLTRFVAASGGILAVALVSCNAPKPPQPPDPQAALIEKGRQIFFNETFNGNGRTCGTCHPAENGFTIDPAFIARLPKDNPLFVAEFTPALSKNFEKPRLMREFGLILENLDGFEDLEHKFVMRGVPHTLSLRTSVNSPKGPRLGWSGDGSPGDGSLRSFATGAVIQHFTKSLNRVPGVDFRLPTDAELDALEAFQLSLGRQKDLTLPLPLKGTVAKRGQEIFMDTTLGKCVFCHSNAGATAVIRGNNLGNANFNTGVESLPDLPSHLADPTVPVDDGFGRPGDSTFNVPPLVEAASTPPFFHNNAVSTIEAAVAFYDGNSFNDSPAGKLLQSLDPQGNSIELDATEISAVAAFLRVINVLESIRQADGFLSTALTAGRDQNDQAKSALKQAITEIGRGIQVLAEAQLHPGGVAFLEQSQRLALESLDRGVDRDLIRRALAENESARNEMVETQDSKEK